MTGVLSSWKDGPTKQAVLDFVGASTRPGPRFVPPADRIAAFDNDGTLWCEQPLPPQFDFQFRKWSAEVEADPTLADQQPCKAVKTDNPYMQAKSHNWRTVAPPVPAGWTVHVAVLLLPVAAAAGIAVTEMKTPSSALEQDSAQPSDRPIG